MNKTTNPETYFSRYKLASDKACMISDYLSRPIYNGMNARQIYEMLSNPRSRDNMHKAFIDRLFDAGKEDLLVYSLYEVGLGMSPQVRQYFVHKLAGKTYHFCKVRFNDNSNKVYTYVTKDRGITIGDTVTVPTGNGFVPESTVLQVVDVFDSSIDKLGFSIEKLRCVERKLKSVVCPHCGASLTINVAGKTGKCTHCGADFYFL